MRKALAVFLLSLLLPLSANAVCDAGYQLNISTGLCEACPAGTYSDGTAITLDISIGGNDFTPRQPDGGTTWSTTFDYGTIYGISGCNPNSSTFLENSTGDYCWCKITSTTNTNWTYVYAYDYDETTCSSTCAHACGYFMYRYASVRLNVCSSATCQSCTNKPANSHYTSYSTPSVMYAVESNCPWECDTGYGRTENDTCDALCTAGITQLKTSTGLSYNLYANKNTSPAIHIKPDGSNTVCYVNLAFGISDNAVNVKYNGATYHSTN